MPLTLSGTNGVSGVDGSNTTPSVRGGTSASNGVFYGTNTVSIATNSTTAVTVDSSQNVGIGTSSPDNPLTIVSNNNSQKWLRLQNSNAGSSASNGILFGNDGNSAYGALVLNSSTNTAVAGANGLYFGTYGAYPFSFMTSSVERARIDSSGNVLVTGGGGLGYGTGSGGTVTQATSKTTGVTINKTVGQITTAADALGAGATAAFTVTNSTFAAVDCVVLNSQNINYSVRISDNAAGSFKITIKNESAGSLSQAVVINFAVIKGATS